MIIIIQCIAYTQSSESEIANQEFEGLNLGWTTRSSIVSIKSENNDLGGLNDRYWILIWVTVIGKDRDPHLETL